MALFNLCCPRNSQSDSDDETSRILRPRVPVAESSASSPPSNPQIYQPPAGGRQYSEPSSLPRNQTSLRRNQESSATSKPKKGAPGKEPYYRGRISTRKAEDFLKHTQRLDGTFLVRDPEISTADRKPDFILSLMRDGVVYHLDIIRAHDKKYSLSNAPSAKSFRSVAKLVSYYQSKPIDLAGGGSVLLKYYVPAE